MLEIVALYRIDTYLYNIAELTCHSVSYKFNSYTFYSLFIKIDLTNQFVIENLSFEKYAYN